MRPSRPPELPLYRVLTLLALSATTWLMPVGPAHADPGHDLVTRYDNAGLRVMDVVPSSLLWQNDVPLAQGEWPIDLALHASLIRQPGRADNAYAVGYGPVLQSDWGRTQLSANIFFERSFDTEEGQPIQMKYHWQLRHHWHPLMNFGLQGFGELRRWGHRDEEDRQPHRAGPAFFGHVDLGRSGGDQQALLYQAAYLLGSVYSKHASMFTVRVQLRF
jgi:hypothetical protein